MKWERALLLIVVIGLGLLLGAGIADLRRVSIAVQEAAQ